MASFGLLTVVVVMVFGANGPADGPRVCIEYVNGWKYPIHVYLNGTVRQMKETIQRKSFHKVAPSMQTVKFKGQTLDDDMKLEDYGIEHHSSLSMEYAPGYADAVPYFFDIFRKQRGQGPKPAVVYVDIENYDSFDMEVDLTYTVDEFKRKIFEQEEYPVERQKVIFKGIILSGNKTLEDYGVVSSSVLKLKVPYKWCFNHTFLAPRTH